MSTNRRAAARARLPEYEAKRDFSVTTEPAPRATPLPAGAPMFMVHKHHAKRLHYDLRLEIDGALASWAIPKGPSYDPAVKRLAIQTEDHPMEYGSFEGRIPDDEYGGGDSLIWDRGTVETVPPGELAKQRAKGHLHLELHGEKLRGRWHLVRTRPVSGKAQWLFFKATDELANPAYDVVIERPESVVSRRTHARGPERARVLRGVHPPPEKLLERVFPPMLATLVESLPEPDERYRFELKYDGYRALAAMSAGRVAMWSRNGIDLAARFPGIARALSGIVVGEAVIDGEIAVLDARGVPHFELIQRGEQAGAVLFAFDLLWLDGEDLRGRPLEARRDLLVSLLSNAPDELAVAERLEMGSKPALGDAAARGFEGIVAKLRGSVYEGSRSRTWLKLKAQQTQELAIVGFSPSKGNDRQLGALHLAVAENGRLRYAGKVGTGFSSKQRTELRKELARDQVPEPPAAGTPRVRDAIWVEPKLVAQVRFTEWTADGKLRHPAFQGLRPDKTPLECVREVPASPAALAPKKPAPKVKLTHADRLLYPEDGITKRDVADYYDLVSKPLLKTLADRPVALEHWHDGIERAVTFRQKLAPHAPAWIRRVETPTRTRAGAVTHMIVDSHEALRWLAQNAALTIHMWSSRASRLGEPDWMLFDLDPAEGRGIEQAVPVALVLHKLFEELRLPSVPKTSGKRGLHVFVPLAPGHTHEQVIEFAVGIGAAVEQLVPEVTLERSLQKRRGRLYLDCYQNGYGKTVVAPYSLRGAPGAPVSTPLRWSEVNARLDPSKYDLRTVPDRLAKLGDLFEPALEGGVRLPRLHAHGTSLTAPKR